MNPCIAYIQLHHFYALLEAKHQPALRGKPFAIVRSGKIIDASFQCEQFNIYPGMGLRQAHLACPSLRVVNTESDPEPHLEKFKDICASLTPIVEPVGELGVFLDLSGFGKPHLAVKKVITKLMREWPFPWYMGTASSKLAAKIACREAVNQGKSRSRSYFLSIEPAQEKAFLAPLSVECLWPWPQVHKKLQNLGVYTIGQLFDVPRRQLCLQLGEKMGNALYDAARGVDSTPVQSLYPPKTVQGYLQLAPEENGCTNRQSLIRSLLPALHEAAARLGAKGSICTRLKLFVEYDIDGEHAVQRVFEHHPKDGLQTKTELLHTVEKIIMEEPWPGPILGMRFMLMGLKPSKIRQTNLMPRIWGPKQPTQFVQTVAALQNRFGSKNIFLAKDMVIPRRERMLQLLIKY